jgi:hypothetical protein
MQRGKREILREICGLDEHTDDSCSNDASALLPPCAHARDALAAEECRAEWHDHRARREK